MNDCEYLQKKAAQQGKGIKYDEVIAMLRPHLIKHGVVMVINQLGMECLACVEGTKQKVYQGHYQMDLINMDTPEEKVTHTVYAQGMDGGDKGPGKAHTYAMKAMLVKGFAIETGEDEESRAEQRDVNYITQEQQEELAGYINGNAELWGKVCRALKIKGLQDLKASKYQQCKNMVSRNANN
jgi:hypothetical protein